MAEGFQVFPDDIGASAGKLLEIGQSLGSDIDSFQAQTESLTSGFGDDDLGSAIATIYQAASEAAFESFHDNAEGLGEIGQELQAMAEEYSQIDVAHQEAFQQLMGRMT
ncbi:hypothetical protein [Saccharopolyspora sp. NPDC002686]|uniref:hypothetical protein n=1 Tax=Saccharopolyspora sp. NPDC002686 TaxID=3154541 RepID=UPI0033176946